MKAGTYWAIVVALIMFGGIAIFSIGAPFFLLGIILAVLSPWRGRRGVLATGIAAILGLVAGYALVAPLTCTARFFPVVGEGQSEGTTTCSNLLGITYEGSGNYNPSVLPALLAGIALAAIAGVTTALLSRRRGAQAPSHRAVPQQP
ncbi:MAG TPA: hypothetical protein VNP90_10800 [Actinomycetota bacterium]|nr:hypothetical protein [Actinomycetota bacterium]